MHTNVPRKFRRGRGFGKLDSCCDATPWKLPEWKKQQYSRIAEDEIPFAPSVQTLPCGVNFHSSFTETPSLNSDGAQCELINLTQSASVPVEFGSEDGPRSVDWDSCPVEQRVRSGSNRLQAQDMAVSGKTFAVPERLQSKQRDGEVRSMWSDVELLVERGFYRDASGDGTLSAHAGRSHPPTSRVQDGTDDNCVRGSPEDREGRGQTRTLVYDPSTRRRVYTSTWFGTENMPDEETCGSGTCDTEVWNLPPHQRRVRQSGNTGNGRDEFWHTVEQT